MDSERAHGGGVRQRKRARESAAAPSRLPKSALAQYLITCWCWGLMSPQTAQKVAKCAQDDIRRAKEDNMMFDDLELLAGLGNGGSNPNAINSQLRQKLRGLIFPNHWKRNCL